MPRPSNVVPITRIEDKVKQIIYSFLNSILIWGFKTYWENDEILFRDCYNVVFHLIAFDYAIKSLAKNNKEHRNCL